MPTWKKIIVSGSNAHLSTVTASAFTASAVANAVGFIGTSSWAQSASNATNAVSASFLPVGTYQITASWAQSASQALTASFVTGSIFSGGNLALSASHAVTAAFALNVTTPTSVVSASVVQIFDSSSANGTFYPTFVNATSGHPSQSVDTDLTYNPSTNTLSAVNITLSGDIAVNGGDITTTATTFNLLSGATTAINIGASNTNVTIPGNLVVNGSTTTVSSSNLLVADRFILLASGSTTNTDGGIIVQNAANGTGSALYYDGDNTRWALATAVGQSDTAAAPNSYVVAVSGAAADPAGNPVFGGSDAARIGAMYVNTTTQDIWIWS